MYILEVIFLGTRLQVASCLNWNHKTLAHQSDGGYHYTLNAEKVALTADAKSNFIF